MLEDTLYVVFSIVISCSSHIALGHLSWKMGRLYQSSVY